MTDKVTLYLCTECHAVDPHDLDSHILRCHRPPGSYQSLTEEDEAAIENMQERIEIPVSELRAYAVEGGE